METTCRVNARVGISTWMNKPTIDGQMNGNMQVCIAHANAGVTITLCQYRLQ